MNLNGFDLRPLARALKTCARDQGRVARANARARVVRALKALREQLDGEYPGISKPRKAPITSLPARRRRLQEAGYALVPATHMSLRMQDYALVGISVRALSWWVTEEMTGRRSERLKHTEIWAPAWALEVELGDTTTLRKLKDDVASRKAFVVQQALQSDSP